MKVEIMTHFVGGKCGNTLIESVLNDVPMSTGGDEIFPSRAVTGHSHENYLRLIVRTPGDYIVTGTTKIDAHTAKAMIDSGEAAFVDMRSSIEFERDHIPGAHNIESVADLSKERLSEIVGKVEKVVFYCHGKRCPNAAFASAKAITFGFKNIYYFPDGYPAWVEAGYPVEGGQF